MLALMCEAAGNRFAVDALQVVEVVARIRLQSLTNSPDWLEGVCVYRGQVTPVMDLAFVVAARPSRPCWANRIIMVRMADVPSSPVCGLIVENVAVSQLASESVSARAENSSSSGNSQWGPVLLDSDGMFQLLDLSRLFSSERRERLTLFRN
jgi:chemotaxis-related protein WspB